MTGPLFTQAAAATLTQYGDRIDTCLAKLSDEQIWSRGSEIENAIGNLVLHLAGNLRQYTRHAVLGEADTRERDDEFNAEGGVTGAALAERLRAVVADATAIIRAIPEPRLSEKIIVQNREMAVLEAIFKTTEHFAMHAGQIMYATKLLTHESLGFFTHNKAKV